MTTKNVADFVADLSAFLNAWSTEHGVAPAAPATAAAKKAAATAKAKAAPEPEDDEDEADNAERRAELEAMTVAALRKIAIKAGFAKDDVADATKVDLVETILDDEANDEDDEEEVEDETEEDEAEDEDDEESEDEEGEDYTREDFEKLGLRQIQTIAKSEYDLTPADYKGMDKDTLIGYLLGEDEAEEEDEEEADEDEDEGYTKEDLTEMSLADLKGIAKDNGIKVRPGMAKSALIKALLA